MKQQHTDLLDQEYAPKVAAAAAARAAAASEAAKEARARQCEPIADRATLDQATDALARGLGAKKRKKNPANREEFPT